MTAVMIGVDPHKGSHTAVAIDAAEEPLGKLRVRASAAQAQRLVAWAASWPERTWAVEGAGGLGRLLDWQLAAAGERVLDVQPKLGARVRLLATGASNKNDPNDALSVAIAALRSRTRSQVTADDHAAVLKVWSRRHRDLGRAKNQVACRLHAVLCELVPGGVPEEITAAQAARILERSTPSGTAGQARLELAAELLADMRRLDAQMRESKKKLATAVKASGTSLTEIFGVGPVISATVIADAGQVARFPSRDHFAAYDGTAPIEVSSGNRKIHRLSLRGNRRDGHAIHMAAITQIRHPHSDGRAYYDKKVAEGKTHKQALRCLKRRISDAIYARLQAGVRAAAQTPATGPGGQPGNDSDSSAAGSHPERRLFGQATPEPSPTLRSATPARPTTPPRPASKKPAKILDTSSKEGSFCAVRRLAPIHPGRTKNGHSCAPATARRAKAAGQQAGRNERVRLRQRLPEAGDQSPADPVLGEVDLRWPGMTLEPATRGGGAHARAGPYTNATL
jgi:transposase